MSKFTQGPWVLNINDKKEATISGNTRGWGWDHLVNFGVKSTTTEDGCSEELKANAHLIAAAPELYKALELAESTLEIFAEHYTFNEILSQIKRTLATARGEQ
jgi:hypothetical protein